MDSVTAESKSYTVFLDKYGRAVNVNDYMDSKLAHYDKQTVINWLLICPDGCNVNCPYFGFSCKKRLMLDARYYLQKEK